MLFVLVLSTMTSSPTFWVLCLPYSLLYVCKLKLYYDQMFIQYQYFPCISSEQVTKIPQTTFWRGLQCIWLHLYSTTLSQLESSQTVQGTSHICASEVSLVSLHQCGKYITLHTSRWQQSSVCLPLTTGIIVIIFSYIQSDSWLICNWRTVVSFITWREWHSISKHCTLVHIYSGRKIHWLWFIIS